MKMQEEQPFEALVLKYRNSLVKLCYGYLNDYQLAEDAVQETFLKALRAYPAFEGRSNEKTWLTRIAINCCKNIQRKRWYYERPSGWKLDAGDKKEALEQVVERDALSRAMNQLKEPERQTIEMYYQQGLSVSEISERTGVSEAALNQRLSRARKRLKILLITGVLMLGGIVGAALGSVQKNHVNRETLPELDPMRVVSIAPLEEANGKTIKLEYPSYQAVQAALGITLLDLPEKDGAQGPVLLRTDGEDHASLQMESFEAVGDQKISLSVDLVLSAEQLAHLWSTDYLGAYRFVEQTVSEKGYKVDVLEETQSEAPCRIALFVVDGVRYTMKGRVTEEVLLQMISSLR